MLLIITIFLVSIALIALSFKFSYTESCLDIIVSMLAFFSVSSLIIASAIALEIHSEEGEFIEEYEYVKSVIDDGEYYDPSLYETVGEKIVSINTKISHNRARSSGFWTWKGAFRSNKIAELPYIRVPNYTEEE